MHETLGDANEVFFKSNLHSEMGDSKDSGLSTVAEEPDDFQTNPSGINIPNIVINNGGSRKNSAYEFDEEDEEFRIREEERIKEMYQVLNITRRKSVAKTKKEGLAVAMDYVRRASTVQGLAVPGQEGGGGSRRGSIMPSQDGSTSSRRGSVMPRNNARRPSTIFMPPKNYRDRAPSIF